MGNTAFDASGFEVLPQAATERLPGSREIIRVDHGQEGVAGKICLVIAKYLLHGRGDIHHFPRCIEGINDGLGVLNYQTEFLPTLPQQFFRCLLYLLIVYRF